MVELVIYVLKKGIKFIKLVNKNRKIQATVMFKKFARYNKNQAISRK